jgi:hypothetical protein
VQFGQGGRKCQNQEEPLHARDHFVLPAVPPAGSAPLGRLAPAGLI